MPKFTSGDSPFPDYATVAERITLFYERYPTGRILTRLHSRTEREITFRALVFRDSADAKPAATGWASEREGDGEINEVACLENTETSAIGRALANLGFTASSRRPSREEMEKAQRERFRLTRERQPRSWDASTPTVKLEASRALRVVSEPRSVLSSAHPVTLDALELLAEAARSGMAGNRVARIEGRLASGRVGIASIERLERALRRWLDAVQI
jgi:hypothetical protein